VNSCVNSPEDGPVGPKHVEIRQYTNKIEIVTSAGFHSICFLNLFIFTDAVHVSCGFSAHHQEHITVHTASGIVNQYCC